MKKILTNIMNASKNAKAVAELTVASTKLADSNKKLFIGGAAATAVAIGSTTVAAVKSRKLKKLATRIDTIEEIMNSLVVSNNNVKEANVAKENNNVKEETTKTTKATDKEVK